jgi:ethanolamine utilization microcompartment shell protein EutL
MSWFPRPVSPRAAIADLLSVARHSSREQRIGAALALLVTAIIVIEFIVDAKMGTAPPPQVTYVELYPSNRTDAEIVADQKKDQAAKEAAKKAQQREFQKLENRFGIE